MSDYASPEERQQAIKEKFKGKGGAPVGHPFYGGGKPFEKGHAFYPAKTEEARKGWDGPISPSEARIRAGVGFENMPPERLSEITSKTNFKNMPPEKFAEIQAKGHAASKNMPKAYPGNLPSNETAYKSFAKMIRGLTNNGWELVEAVHTMFQEAYAERNFDRTLNAATWLADRGFGKPVQVTALTDAEGNPVAFQLWQPMTNEASDNLEEPPVVINHVARPDIDTSAPPTKVEKQPDIYALGPARIWGQDQDKEQIDE